MKRPSDLLRVFVYGSLKQGFTNHDDYCRGALSIEPAAVRGLLFEHPSGFPVVRIDRDDILAEGTADPAADMAVQRAFASRISLALGPPGICPAEGRSRKAVPPFGNVVDSKVCGAGVAACLPRIGRLESLPHNSPNHLKSTALPPLGPWRLVQGELMAFDDPEVRLPALDGLEGFHPDEPTLYRRVLLLAQPAHGPLVVAWAYVLGASAEELTFLPSSSWTPGRKPP